MNTIKNLKKIRIATSAFLVLLVLSGITAFPLRQEMAFLMAHLDWFPTALANWIRVVDAAIEQTPDEVLYGMDWLAFGHIVIGLFFIPVIIDPVKYKINLCIGMIACGLVFPLAFICGPIRSIPFFHQLIDCSFGLFGFILLYCIYRMIPSSQNINAIAIASQL